jgi:DNA-binding LytR/AlgR family response regulator
MEGIGMLPLQLSVSKDEEGKKGALNVGASDVLFLEFDEKRVFVHTLEDRFYIGGSLSYWVEALKAAGYDFEKVDRNIVVHMPKIKRLDSIYTIAYFEYEVEKNSKKITLAQKYYKKVVSKAREENRVIVIN